MAKKAGLGRGLDALMGDLGPVEQEAPKTTLPLTDIKANANQPRERFDEEKLEELASSIKRNGLLQPILVRPKGKKYEIVAGERRYRAAKLAGLKEVPVVIREVGNDEILRLALIENLQRADLDPVEEARGYRALADSEGLTQSQIAEAVSKSRSYIANAMRLLELPEPVQVMLEQGLLSAGHARAILAVPTDEGRVKLANQVVENNLTVRQTEALAPLYTGQEVERKPRAVTPESYKRAARQLREALGARVRVKQTRGKNKIEIEFDDEDDLGRLLGLMVRWGERDA